MQYKRYNFLGIIRELDVYCNVHPSGETIHGSIKSHGSMPCYLETKNTNPDYMSLEQVAAYEKVTRERIRQIEAEALRKLRKRVLSMVNDDPCFAELRAYMPEYLWKRFWEDQKADRIAREEIQ